MKKREKKYRILISILVAAIILQWIIIIFLGRKPAPGPVVKLPPPIQAIKGRIAVVIDDWGYNQNNLALLDEIKYPFTASVLPGLAYSRKIAERLHDKGFEVILHLPLEPREKLRLEKNTIMCSMGADKIKSILINDLESVLYAQGVSNHMGSKATQDEKTMRAVFSELKRRRLYFLDSLVSVDSLAGELAQSMGLRVAKRDIFLYNKSDPEYIRSQLSKLKSKAKEQGGAVGIGHDRKNTLKVLAQEMSKITEEGYKFVFVSEIAE